MGQNELQKYWNQHHLIFAYKIQCHQLLALVCPNVKCYWTWINSKSCQHCFEIEMHKYDLNIPWWRHLFPMVNWNFDELNINCRNIQIFARYYWRTLATLGLKWICFCVILHRNALFLHHNDVKWAKIAQPKIISIILNDGKHQVWWLGTSAKK